MTDNFDDILKEIEQNKHKWNAGIEDSSEVLNKAQEERREKVASFQLDLNLDDEFGEYTPQPVASADDVFETQVVEVAAPTAEIDLPEAKKAAEKPAYRTAAKPKEEKKPQKKLSAAELRSREMWGCAGSVFYILLILGVSLVLACVVIMAALDLTGLNKSGVDHVITLEEGVTADDVADMLLEENLIDHKIFFKLYSKLTGDDSEYRSGVYSLSANMGYGNITDILRSGPPREVVRVTIPEGYTVDEIAALMEKNAVCTKKDFYNAVLNGDYSDFTFVAAIPEETGRYEGRGYALEGYLFPDTYDFYTGSTGESVVRKLLNNFDNRVNTTYKTKIAAGGMTVNDAVILASIVQAEAAADEWSRVARVFSNRMAKPSEFPRLQSDATIHYYKGLDLTVAGLSVSQDAYDTAVREGLTPGAVGNPGLKAIDAVLSPSNDSDVKDCYYFATDLSTGITYFSKTYSQHLAVCQKYGIGQSK